MNPSAPPHQQFSANVRLDRGVRIFDFVYLYGSEISEALMIRAGAVVTKDTPAGVVVAGNPARILRNI